MNESQLEGAHKRKVLKYTHGFADNLAYIARKPDRNAWASTIEPIEEVSELFRRQQPELVDDHNACSFLKWRFFVQTSFEDLVRHFNGTGVVGVRRNVAAACTDKVGNRTRSTRPKIACKL